MIPSLSITVPHGIPGYDLAWGPQGDAVIRWDDDGWVMETWRDGSIVDLVNVTDHRSTETNRLVDWNAVMRRVEELAK